MEIKDPLDAKATFPIVIMSMGNKKSPMAVCRYLLRMDVQLAMFGLDVAGLLLEPFVKFQSIATRKKHFYNARAPPVVYKVAPKIVPATPAFLLTAPPKLSVTWTEAVPYHRHMSLQILYGS
jgi:hypothetical protein